MEVNQNIIQQLQQTPKWKEFEEWYNTFYIKNGHVPSLVTLEQVPVEMYKGVFEKFIEYNQHMFNQICNSNYKDKIYSIWTDDIIESNYSKSFEELLICYFNN